MESGFKEILDADILQRCTELDKVTAMYRHFADAGYTKVMLWVFQDNLRARKFYEAQGFTTDGKIKKDSSPLEICYEKDLTEKQI